MTWISLFNSFLIMILLISLFTFYMIGVNLFIILLGLSLSFLILETSNNKNIFHYIDSFWLFIFSEIMVFFSLLCCCLWFNENYIYNLSHYLEIPFFGCFLLIGSSLTATYYHNFNNIESTNNSIYLTIILGVCFIILQLIEFSDCSINILTSVYHSSCFCTVGLHFSHVIIGLFLLISILLLDFNYLNQYYINIIIWYWHFVDYIWLLVFSIVYLF
uniref:Cytochrome c oxidase subunit 3 n=1 Tax=Paratetraonchoides inermis TaxID=2048240 RepID=A0A2D1GRR9_9PLAT|nr:cytochrome c oxidase subunit III [Paratetraonchoides inermis]ATN95409.1 cytochrome c oxidase subunit 3 [Paratetraonchoides inermis]